MGQVQTRQGQHGPPVALPSTAVPFSPDFCPEMRHKHDLTWLAFAPELRAGECHSGWAASQLQAESTGLIPQRSHYHVITSMGDTVCMGSLGRL